jgi:hypothetical protein
MNEMLYRKLKGSPLTRMGDSLLPAEVASCRT